MNGINKEKKKVMKKILRLITSFVFCVLLITLLKVVDWDFFVTFSYVPTVQDVFKELFVNLGRFGFYHDILSSLGRVYLGFGCAAVLAIPFAILIVENEIVKNYVYPIFEIIRPIPNVAWVPMSIVLFKTINSSVLFITFIGAFFPILINTVEGFEHINENYIKIAKSFHINEKTYITEVMLPAAAPHIFTGLLIGMSGSWLGVVVAEMISGQSGIGYLTWVNYTLINMPGVVMCMLVIGGLGAISSWIIRKSSKLMHLDGKRGET